MIPAIYIPFFIAFLTIDVFSFTFKTDTYMKNVNTKSE